MDNQPLLVVRDDDSVICPHCGASYQAESEDFSETVRKETCFTCKKEYEVWQEFSVSHCTAANPVNTPPTEKQVAFLMRNGVDVPPSKEQAAAAIGNIITPLRRITP